MRNLVFFCKKILSLEKKTLKDTYTKLLYDYNQLLKIRLKNVEMTNFFKSLKFADLKDVIIVSAAYESELKDILYEKGIFKYVEKEKIYGSPKSKIENIKLYNKNYDNLKCLIIGDSKSDYDIAQKLGFHFYFIDNWSAENSNIRKKLKIKSTRFFDLLDNVFDV